MQTLYSVQYLRAFAAIAVVLFHAAERSGAHFAIGAAGVDVFFVISGFIMIVIAARRPQTPLGFLKDRFLRVAPSYWIVTSIMILGAAAGLFPNLVLDPAHVLGSYLFVPVPSPNQGALWPVLVQGWTLNYEMFFYLVFALTLLLPARLRLPALAITFGLLTLIGLVSGPQGALSHFYTRPLLLEFVAGALLGKVWLTGKLPPAHAGFGLALFAILGFAAIDVLRMDFDAWICGPLATCLVTGMLSLEKTGAIPKLPALAYLGDASYSIYLWHTLAISVVVKIGMLAGLPVWALVWMGAVFGTVLGLLCYECLERPLHHLIRHRQIVFRLPGRSMAK